MVVVLSVSLGVVSLVAVFFLWRWLLLRRALRDLIADVGRVQREDTNTLLSVATGDRFVRALAVELNRELRALRAERRRVQCGDAELRDAVTNVSHDLRTPLTAVCGYLDLLQQQPKSEAVARYLAKIEERIDALRELTEELFRYSVLLSVRDERMTPVSLGRALEEAMASAYAAFSAQGIVPCVTQPEHAVVRMLDGVALGRVLDNIIGNALKYSAGDFAVTLTEGGEMIFENCAPELTPVTVGRLFDRFFTVETGRRSTGLGLSIAKLLTERMGGSIRAELGDGRLRIILDWREI